MQNTVNCLAIVQNLYFRFWLRFWMPTTGSASKFTQMMLMDWSMKANLEKQNAGTLSQRMKVQRLSTVTMLSQKKNSASKSRIKTGRTCWQKFLLRLEISSMCQVAPCMLSGQASWFLKPNSLVIQLTASMTLTVRMIMATCVNFTLKNLSMFWTLESLPIAVL